mmetsp:Transcript_3543/g.5977  ORF Transcript_3543/g.5977 Transcript_3543/m.5977 type:complete len:263 (+) Transcript_3543:47-835(+)
MADAPVTYSLKYQARALCATNSKLASAWVVGTNALRDENEIRVLQYDADGERLVCTKCLTHGPEIWDIATTAASQDLLLTVWSQGQAEALTHGVTLWSLQGSTSVTRVADLPGHQGIIRRALWHPNQHDLAVTVEEGGLRTWSISDQGASATAQAQAGELLQLWSGALQPQAGSAVCATAGGNNVQLWDLRSMRMTGEVLGAHRMPTRDVCFSPTCEFRLVSSGDDCRLRVWDTRYLGKSEAALELGGHSHWVWRGADCPLF